MEEIAKIIKHFFYRDFAYIISGGMVIWCFLNLFNRSDLQSLSNPQWLFLAGLAYAIGYALQDCLASLGCLVTVGLVWNPRKYVKWLFRTFEKRDWTPISAAPTDEYIVVISSDNETLKGTLIRYTNLQSISAAVGSGSALSFLFLLAKSIWTGDQFDIALATSALLLAFALCNLSWLKGAQIAKASCEFSKRIKSP